jgi:hypothetical protein
MKRKEEDRSVIEPSCTFFKPNKINFLPSNRVLDRKPDRVTGYNLLRSFATIKPAAEKILSDGIDVDGTVKYRRARTES